MPPLRTTSTALPADFVVARGQTQVGVNYTILTQLVNRFPATAALQVLGSPCDNLEFLTYVGQLFLS
jgi:hypothetical protein